MNLNNGFNYIVKSAAKVCFIFYNSNTYFNNYDIGILPMRQKPLAFDIYS